MKENIEIHKLICEIISSDKERQDFYYEENFWAISLKNSNFFEINENDFKILSYVSKVWIELLDEENHIISYSINFQFHPNDYLLNEVVWKTYIYDKNNSFSKSESCNLKWKSNECIPTRRLLTKRKSGSKNNEWQEVESFFKIFSPIQVKSSMVYEEHFEKEEKEADFFLNDYTQNCMEYFLRIIPGHD